MIKFNDYIDLKKDCDRDLYRVFEEALEKINKRFEYKNVSYISPSDFF